MLQLSSFTFFNFQKNYILRVHIPRLLLIEGTDKSIRSLHAVCVFTT